MGKKILLQDRIAAKGQMMTCGSALLEDFISTYDSFIVERLKAKEYDYTFIKSVDEFGIDDLSEDHKNQDGQYIIGASKEIALELLNNYNVGIGTDTKGDTLLSASSVGLYGFRPSNGLISKYGVFSSTNLFDNLGFIGKNVSDIKTLFKDLLGKDERDLNSRNFSYSDQIEDMTDFSFLVVGDIDYSGLINDKEIKVEKLSNIDFDIISSIYMILSSVSFSSNTARFDGIRYGKRVEATESIDDLYKKTRSKYFTKLTKEKILLGYYFQESSNKEEFFKKSYSYLKIFRKEFESYFQDYDFIISPVFAENDSFEGLDLYKNAQYTQIPVLLGYPCACISVNNQTYQIISYKDTDDKLLNFIEKLGGIND